MCSMDGILATNLDMDLFGPAASNWASMRRASQPQPPASAEVLRPDATEILKGD